MRSCHACGAHTTRKWERGGIWCAACFKTIAAKVIDLFEFRMNRKEQ